MPTLYDDVAYPSAAYPYTHPGSLAAIAILSGMRPADVRHCRVLELGCGEGFNVISMAHGLPRSSFVGIDLAPGPVARGNATIKKLRLRNISLHAQDVATVEPDLGEFDYIIANGLYSWVPAVAREKIMALCGAHLSAHGVAYISYNAYPGNHVRDLTRGMMRYHLQNFVDPFQQIRQARGLLQFLGEAGDPHGLYRQMVLLEGNRIGTQSDASLLHDDLNPNNQAFYFHEFMAQAHGHGLQFLGESEISSRREPEYPPHVRDALAQLDPDDVVTGEQYRDFLNGRAFRQTLLCRQGISLERTLNPAHLPDLYIGADRRSSTANFERTKPGTSEALTASALQHLGATWPNFVHFPDLLDQSAMAGNESGGERLPTAQADLAGAMLQLAIAGQVELRAQPPRLVRESGPCPRASQLARLQIEAGPRVSSQLHRVVELDNGLCREFLRLLDGTRSRSDLRNALQDHLGDATQPLTAQRIEEDEIESALERFGRLGLLVA